MEEKITRRGILKSALVLAAGASALSIRAADGHSFADLNHEHFMRLAIEQAKKVPRCPFGSVIVNMKTKAVVSEGWVRINTNPIWHGEMTAINNCPSEDTGFNWADLCLYTTGESCPMCQSAIIWTGMPLVVYGSSMPFLQTQGFGEINIRAEKVNEASLKGKCTIIGGVLEKECNELFVLASKMS